MKTWSKKEVEKLCKLWEEGLSGSQIAVRLGTGKTRNAVIGRVHRMGLSSRTSEPTLRHSARRAAPPPKPKPKPVVPFEAPPPIVKDGSYVTIMSIRANQCRWPVDGPDTDEIYFCGNTPDGPDENGVASSYCKAHRQLGTQPSKGQIGRGKWKRT